MSGPSLRPSHSNNGRNGSLGQDSAKQHSISRWAAGARCVALAQARAPGVGMPSEALQFPPLRGGRHEGGGLTSSLLTAASWGR